MTADGTMTGLENDVRTAYRRFGELEARGNSPFYEKVCALIVRDDAACSLISELPEVKRQPNLVLAAARWLGAPTIDPEEFVEWTKNHWSDVEGVVLHRATQTNEVGRCAVLLPFLLEAVGDRPVALFEAGCSAGLALYPDLYAYRYVDVSGDALTLGNRGSSPELICRVNTLSPLRDLTERPMPRVVWRGGVDLNPLDVLGGNEQAAENARWLEALIWPGQPDRSARLSSAIGTVRTHIEKNPDDVPHLTRGDLDEALEGALASVPEDTHLVMWHSAVLAYVDRSVRERFVSRVRTLASRSAGLTWLSNEAFGVTPGVDRPNGEPDDAAPGVEKAGRFLLGVNGIARAEVGPHGQEIHLTEHSF